MPLFVRAGSILPRAPLMDFSDQKPVDPLTLEVYAGARPAAFNLYEDDGLSLAYRAGAYAWTPFHFRPAPAGNYTLSLGAAQGNFKGQLAKRRYLVRLHGLCQPQAVALNGRRLTEVDPEQGLDGWWWDARARTIMVRLNKPLSAGQENVLSFSNAGTSADLAAWQRASNLRAQLRQLKRDVKLKHAALVSGPGIKKPPRAMREIEAVERLLTDVVDHPKGRGTNPPDYPALESRIVAALANDPFESNRALPELDPESRAGMDLCKGAKFTSQEMTAMTNRLRGADSPAWLWPAR
jgi:hypothetical protein